MRHSTLTSDAFPNRRAAGTTSSDALVMFKVSTCRAASTAIILPASMHCRTSVYRIKLSTAARHGTGRYAGESTGADFRAPSSAEPSASRASALRLRDTMEDGIVVYYISIGSRLLDHTMHKHRCAGQFVPEAVGISTSTSSTHIICRRPRPRSSVGPRSTLTPLGIISEF